MVTSEIDIANMALAAVGARTTVSSFTDNTKESNVCALFINQIADSLLRMVPWGWARKQASLTLLADATLSQSVPAPWIYKYQYPSDCVKLRHVIPMYQPTSPIVPGVPISSTYRGPPVKWILNQDTDALGSPVATILTNQQQAIVVYTARTPVQLWDAMFIDAMVGAMAAKICIPVSGDKKLMQMAVQAGKEALSEARVANGNEGIQQQQIMPDWLQVRGCSEVFLWSEDPFTETLY